MYLEFVWVIYVFELYTINPVWSWSFVAYFTKEVNPSLAKPPLNFNGGLANLGFTSLVK